MAGYACWVLIAKGRGNVSSEVGIDGLRVGLCGYCHSLTSVGRKGRKERKGKKASNSYLGLVLRLPFVFLVLVLVWGGFWCDSS